MQVSFHNMRTAAITIALAAGLSACGDGAAPATPAADTTNVFELARSRMPSCAVGFDGWMDGFVVSNDGAGYWFTLKVTRLDPHKKNAASDAQKLVGERIRISNHWGLFYEMQKLWIKDLSPGEHVRVKALYTPQQGGALMMRAQFRVRSPKDLGKIVFLGDSIMHFWGGLQTDFPGYRIYNSGVAGDNTWDVLQRLDYSCLDLSPRAIVVLIGTNDLVFRPLDQIKIEEIIARLRAHRSTMPIILCRVMPRNPASNVLDENVRALNARIDALAAADPDIHLVDTYSAFLTSNGVWDAAYFIDGVHPNTDGYRRWAELLQPVLARALQPY
jgi:lysophospholipase L1-like esterase